MKKSLSRLISILSALCLVLALLPGTVLAAASGSCGDGVTWSYSDGTLTIQGNGSMDGYDGYNFSVIPRRPWSDYIDQIRTVRVGDGVTSVGEFAFSYHHALTGVAISDSVASIEMCAFLECESITDVYYNGSREQWDQLAIFDGNAPLRNFSQLPTAAIHCAVTGDALPEGSGSAPSGGIAVTVKGTAVVWADAAPFLNEDDRVMVPFRAVAETLGLAADWDEYAREAVFTDGAKTISFPIGSSSAYTGEGGAVEMDTAAVIVNDRTYAPIRYLAEYFGYEVAWDGDTQTVSIT